MSRRAGVLVAGAVVAVVAVVAAVTLLGDDSNDGQSAASTTTGVSESDSTNTTAGPSVPSADTLPPTTIDTAGLTGDALELANAVNRAHQLAYHATYQSVAGSVSGSETSTTVEIWRRLPSARRDTVFGEGDDAFHTAEFRTEEFEHVGCLLPGEASGKEDVCLIAPEGGVDAADALIGAGDPHLGAVAASDENIGGVPARCFTLTPSDGSAEQEVCFDNDGIPVVIDGGEGTRLERTAVERDFDDGVFVLPAEPTSDPPTVPPTSA